MPRQLKNALSAPTIANLKTPGKYADGSGLAFQIDQRGNRRWILRLTLNGKETMRGLGPYPAVGLKEARKLAAMWTDSARKVRVAERVQRAMEKAVERAPMLDLPTFWEASGRVLAARKGSWSTEKQAIRWRNTLWTYAYSTIGEKPVDEITTGDVMAIIEPIWLSKGETAGRVKSSIEAVLDWAAAHGYRSGDNPAGKHILKALPKRPKVQHMASLEYTGVPEALKRLAESSTHLYTRSAFYLIVLTASRPGEVRNARWGEIDWEAATWTVPAERMKKRREHKVPLSKQALSVAQ